MQLVEASPDDLIGHLSEIGHRDRAAIIARLSDEQRRVVESRLNAQTAARAMEIERQQRIDRQFLGYTPWLASVIESTENGTPVNLSDAAAKALWEVHSASVASHPPAIRRGWLGIIDRISAIFSPDAGAPQ